MALMIVEFVNESAARAQEGQMILHYYVHLLDTGAQGRKYSVHARACACKQEDSGNRIKRAGRRPFEKDDNTWWRYRDNHLFFRLFSPLIVATLPCKTVLCASIHIT